MMEEELRQLLEQIDPMPRNELIDPLRYRTRMESIMNTAHDTHTTVADTQSPAHQVGGRRHRTSLVVGAIAAGVAAIAISTAVLIRDNDSVTTSSLSIADAGVTISSCIPFDVNTLAAMPVAFGGTATEITPTTVTLDIDHWFTTDAAETDLVAITLPAGNTSAALDGVDFVIGDRYLVTATDGVVNGCGFSGPATPEFEAAFTSAFGG
jgi:hypothetical protein